MCISNLFWEEDDQCMMCQCTTQWWAGSLGWYAMTFGWMNVYFLNAVQHFPLATQTFAVRRNDHWIPKASIKIFYWLQSNTMKISVLLISSLRYLVCTLSPQLGCSVTRSSMFTFILSGQFFFSSKLTWGGSSSREACPLILGWCQGRDMVWWVGCIFGDSDL